MDFSGNQMTLPDPKDLSARRILPGHVRRPLVPRKIHFFGQKKFSGFLDPCDQNQTYHTSNYDKIERNGLGWWRVPLSTHWR